MKYSVGIQSFAEIRKGGYTYANKTAYIWRLADQGKYYFLDRPRRFGKKLLISSIEAYFAGQRELFSRLAIAALEQEWSAYPIFHLDLNTTNYKEEGSLRQCHKGARADSQPRLRRFLCPGLPPCLQNRCGILGEEQGE
jgi:hypothetical protein